MRQEIRQEKIELIVRNLYPHRRKPQELGSVRRPQIRTQTRAATERERKKTDEADSFTFFRNYIPSPEIL